MEEHQKNALIVGKWLEQHPCIESVRHPGLPSHPQHELVKRQCYGHSGMMSFYIKGGLEESKAFLSALKVTNSRYDQIRSSPLSQVVTLAESLGGYESLAELPYLMTHASIEEKERVALGVTSNLVRLSVGLENAEDIMADIDQALKIAVKC